MQVKLRARQNGRKLKDELADLLRKGLAAAANAEPEVVVPVVVRDKQTGLPLIRCKRAASSQEKLTPERVAAVLRAQGTCWLHGAAIVLESST
jgi:hypothetical protein